MPPIELVNPTTYEATLPGGDKVEVGDREAVDFKPHIKLNRWGEECFIKVGLPTTKKIKSVIEGNKVKWIQQDLEAHFYPLEPKTIIAKDKDGRNVEFKQNELGGFEFEVILKKKPKTNKIVLNIETQGLKFYYQPELTPEEIAEGAVRPDNVVGSYAVYHATRTNMHRGKADAEKYKCGKAFHIYRPKIVDAEGNWIWGELSVDEKAGTLTITIDQTWLDNAVYPVSIDPNFGYETQGSGSTNVGMRIYGSWVECPATATAESITAYLTTANSGYKVSYAIYDYVADDDAGSKEGVTEEATLDGSTGWKTLNFSAPKPSLSANTKYFLLGSGSGAYQVKIAQDSYGSTKKVGKTIDSYPDWEDPLTGESGSLWIMSIYCTYEEAGGETHELAGISAGVASVSGSLINQVWLAGITAGIASISAAAKILKKITASISGTASVTGAIKRVRGIAGTIAGVASVSGATKITRKIQGAASGIASVSASLINQKWLQAAVSGVASVSGILSTVGEKFLAGISSGAASVAGAVKVARKLAVSVSGTASVSGGIKVVRKLLATTSGVASVTAHLINQKWLSAVSAGVASVSGAISIIRKLVANVAGVASVVGALTVGVEVLLAAIASGVASVSGGVKVLKKIAGATAGVASITASLSAGLLLKAAISCVASVSGSIKVLRKLVGLAEGTSTISGILGFLPRLTRFFISVMSKSRTSVKVMHRSRTHVSLKGGGDG